MKSPSVRSELLVKCCFLFLTLLLLSEPLMARQSNALTILLWLSTRPVCKKRNAQCKMAIVLNRDLDVDSRRIKSIEATRQEWRNAEHAASTRFGSIFRFGNMPRRCMNMPTEGSTRRIPRRTCATSPKIAEQCKPSNFLYMLSDAVT